MTFPTQFVSYATAAPAPGQASPWVTLLMFGGLFVFMYILMIRPQRKRQKEHRALVDGLGKGDEVVMSSGMLGKVTKVDGDYIEVEASENIKMKFQKAAVHAVLPKGTIKSI